MAHSSASNHSYPTSLAPQQGRVSQAAVFTYTAVASPGVGVPASYKRPVAHRLCSACRSLPRCSGILALRKHLHNSAGSHQDDLGESFQRCCGLPGRTQGQGDFLHEYCIVRGSGHFLALYNLLPAHGLHRHIQKITAHDVTKSQARWTIRGNRNLFSAKLRPNHVAVAEACSGERTVVCCCRIP